jgi:hypothetical protein
LLFIVFVLKIHAKEEQEENKSRKMNIHIFYSNEINNKKKKSVVLYDAFISFLKNVYSAYIQEPTDFVRVQIHSAKQLIVDKEFEVIRSKWTGLVRFREKKGAYTHTVKTEHRTKKKKLLNLFYDRGGWWWCIVLFCCTGIGVVGIGDIRWFVPLLIIDGEFGRREDGVIFDETLLATFFITTLGVTFSIGSSSSSSSLFEPASSFS